MRNNLSVLVIGKNLKDKKPITTKKFITIGESKVDTYFIDSTDNLQSELNKCKPIDLIVTIGNDIDLSPLSRSSFEVRKKWVHFDEYNEDIIADSLISTFMLNINRDRKNSPLFSIFTCTFNTPKAYLDRLYNSLCNQTYANWNWWILDDSKSYASTTDYLEKYHDPRITIIKNVSNHGNIGFNKHVIASACDGDYIVEVDHDDELTPDCLSLLLKAFNTYPDANFVYSHAMEEMDGYPITYGEGFALGYGYYSEQNINGRLFDVAMTPDLNCITVRHIVGLPNHVRCWEKSFYHKIGGHNQDLSVLDDMDILIRTFLYGKLCKVDKVLYIQHEGSSNDNNGRGSTTQGHRLEEIKRIGVILKWKYDEQIHNRILELGYEDYAWDEKLGYSTFNKIDKPVDSFNYTLKVDE